MSVRSEALHVLRTEARPMTVAEICEILYPEQMPSYERYEKASSIRSGLARSLASRDVTAVSDGLRTYWEAIQ